MQRLCTTLFAGAVACLLVVHVPPTVGGPLYRTTEARASADATSKGGYGDVDYADPGYQGDGKPRYPVDTERHIRAAWSYIHKAHNRSMYTSGEVALIEARIIAAWKTKIDPAGPPSAEK